MNNIYDILASLGRVAKEEEVYVSVEQKKSKLEETMAAIEANAQSQETVDENEELEEGPGIIKRGMKSLKRGAKGWTGKGHPADIMQYTKGASDDTLKRLAREPGEEPTAGSPRDFQNRVIDRELKKRYGLTPKGNVKEEGYEAELPNLSPITQDFLDQHEGDVDAALEHAFMMANLGRDPSWNKVIRELKSIGDFGVEETVDEVAQKFTQGGKTYVTGGDEGDEVVQAFDDPQTAQKFLDVNRGELNKNDPDPKRIANVDNLEKDDNMQESEGFDVDDETYMYIVDLLPDGYIPTGMGVAADGKINVQADNDTKGVTKDFVFDPETNLLDLGEAWGEEDPAGLEMPGERRDEFEPGDQVTVTSDVKKWGGKTGKVTLVHGGSVYVKFPGLRKYGEIEFRPGELINHGLTEAFGMYDDFDGPAPDINPELVPFDADNPEHRERLQRGTRVVLVPVLFQDQSADRSGVLTDISKTGFFCKVIRNADGKTINAHMSDIELADLYNNTVYEDFEEKLKGLMEDVTVTRTENPENPELDTITITGTDEHVQMLADMMKMAGLNGGYTQYDDGSAEMVVDPELESIDAEEDEMIAQLKREMRGEEVGEERDIEHANTPREKVAGVSVATDRVAGGLNKPKRQYRDEYPGDNPMAVRKTRNIEEGNTNDLDRVLDQFDPQELLMWSEGDTTSAGEELEQALMDLEGVWDTGSGQMSERIWNNYKDEVQAYALEKLGAGPAGRVDEKAPPGMEDWIKSNKQNFINQYGKEKGLEVLYATAWKRHNNESIEESSMSEFDRILSQYDPRELLAWAEGNSDAATDLADEILGLEGRWDDGSGREEERVWNEYKDEVAGYAQEKLGASESKRPGAALDEVDSFLNLYKAFGERGEKR